MIVLLWFLGIALVCWLVFKSRRCPVCGSKDVVETSLDYFECSSCKYRVHR